MFAFKSKVKELVTPEEVLQMMELIFIERKADQDTLSQDDRMFLSKIKEGIHIRDDGHYEMPIPFKGPDPAFLSNKTMALQHLKQLNYRLRKDTRYRKDYSTFMSNVIQAGFAEPVPPSELERKDGKAWYIPHHGVYHPKKPDKIRILFDCSAEFKGESLNDQVHHQGHGMTMNEKRANVFWIIVCGSVVSNHILQCVKCRKLRSSPL